jgi:hypothetical protein
VAIFEQLEGTNHQFVYPALIRGVIGTVGLKMLAISAVSGLESYLPKNPLSIIDSEITKALPGRLFYSMKPASLFFFSSYGAIAAFGHEDTYGGANRR